MEDDDELQVSGSRVLSGSEFVGLTVESTRYLRPKVGYHGGLTPQETLVRLMVLAQPSVTIRGWQQVVPEPPSWWSAGASPPRARQGDLFSPDRAATKESALSTWLDELVASDIFKAQLAATNGRVSADHVEQTVRALDGSGGRLLKSAFGGRVGITPGRVSSYIAAVQRVLNVDGYGILELDEASQTITLNRQLLLKQFRLE